MLTRWDPFSEMSRLQDELLRGAGDPRRLNRSFAPSVDIVEEADAIVVHVELPGLKLEEVNVGIENEVLTISGERKLESDKNHFVRERWYGEFSRSFKLPRTVDTERVEAELREGVLTVRLPKRENVKPRKIEVRTS